MSAPTPLVETHGLVKHFPLPRTLREGITGAPPRAVHAVDEVSLAVYPGEALGLIGESGSGKSTLGWLIARLHPSTAGEVVFEGQDVTRLRGAALRAWHRKVQMVFQDPLGSLDPRFRVWQIVGEPLRAQNREERRYARREPNRLRREFRQSYRDERERLWLECRPDLKAQRLLTREFRQESERQARLYREDVLRMENEYRRALARVGGVAGRPDVAETAQERRRSSAERERLTHVHRRALRDRAKALRATRERLEKEYRASRAKAKERRLDPEERTRRESEYRAFLQKGRPRPVIPKVRLPPRITRRRLRQRVAETLPTVGLPADCLDQYPHEFSGGGRQRISLARALIVDPKLIILDEPTSALDVAVQAQILNRLVELQQERGVAYLLITHNVAAVRYVAHRVAVMYLGQIVELGGVRDVLEHPIHPYTKALLAALPVADVRRRRTRYRITGEIPTLVNPPPGCRFAARCPFAVERCISEEPFLREIPGRRGTKVSCHRAEEVAEVRPDLLLTTTPLPGAADTPSSPSSGTDN
jgi:oligopeptide/dipeptide ABC transporter ATP-binding protein